MRIRDYLTPGRIDLRLDSTPKAPAIERLVTLVARSLGIADPGPIFHEVMRREEILSTGVGDGIAIPHAGVDGFSDPVIALGVSPRGIEYGALDQKPVHVLFLLLWPRSAPGLQLKALARIARLGRQVDLAARLQAARSPEEALHVIITEDERADSGSPPPPKAPMPSL
jgi:mannitol/fructose-specific phosphotransferase system IIA component (Ntr-type)